MPVHEYPEQGDEDVQVEFAACVVPEVAANSCPFTIVGTTNLELVNALPLSQ
jgi:hypothetical protein